MSQEGTSCGSRRRHQRDANYGGVAVYIPDADADGNTVTSYNPPGVFTPHATSASDSRERAARRVEAGEKMGEAHH
jgi:hypothetical protein